MVLEVYVDCRCQSVTGTANYNPGKPKRTLKLGGPAHNFRMDVELVAKRVLTTDEMRGEWDRLVCETYRVTTEPEGIPAKAAKRTPEQIELTHRVVTAMGKEFQRRGLDKIGSYLTTVRRRAA